MEAKSLGVKSEDSLFAGHSHLKFDLALGNPPYVRFQNLDKSYRASLQKKFATCANGNVDLYFAFIEQCLLQAKKTCLITPNSWLASRSGLALRQLLSTRLLKLIDYGDALVFAPVRAYSCIVYAQATPSANPLEFKNAQPGLEDKAQWQIANRGDARLANSEWQLRGSLTPAGLETLGDIAHIHSGIATLADSAYSFKAHEDENGLCVFSDKASGKTLAISASLCPKRAKLTKIKNSQEIQNLDHRILCPYGLDGKIIDEDELLTRHPDAFAFLDARRPKLALRDKGQQAKYESWFAYGRKQGLKNLGTEKALSLSIMSNNCINPVEIDLSKTGRFLFTSGYILTPKKGHSIKEVKEALSHKDSWTWMLSRGKQWAGGDGDNFISYGSKLLAQLPLPAPNPHTQKPGKPA